MHQWNQPGKNVKPNLTDIHCLLINQIGSNHGDLIQSATVVCVKYISELFLIYPKIISL